MTTSNEFRVGIMFLAGLTLLVILLATLTQWGQVKKTYSVVIHYKNAQGLLTGAPVQVSGVVLGRVASIVLDPATNQPLVTARLADSVRLHENDLYSIGVGGLVGERFVDIRPTPADRGPEVPDGGRVEGATSPDMDELMKTANVLLKKITSTTNSFNEVIGNPENQRNLHETLANMNRATQSATRFTNSLNALMARNQLAVDETVGNLRETSASAAAFTGSLNDIVARNRLAVDTTVANLNTTSASAAEFTAAINDLLKRNRESVDSLIANMNTTSVSAAEFAQTLNGITKRNAQAIDMTAANLQAVSTDLRRVSTALTPQLENTKIISNLEQATQRTVNIIDRLESIANAVSSVISDKELTVNIKDSVRNLKDASAAMEEMMAEARESLKPIPRVAQNLEQATSDLARITGPFRDVAPETAGNIRAISQRLRATSEDISGAAHQVVRLGNVLRNTTVESQASVLTLGQGNQRSRSDFNVDIITPESLLRVGMTDIGNKNNVNAQLGRRIGERGWFRYGLVQSTFGIGATLQPSNSLRTSLELFDPAEIRANALVDFRLKPMGKDWWLTTGWYDVFDHGQSAYGLGVAYRPGIQ